MTITISCPNCRKQSGAPDQCAGQTGQCPYCGSAVPIPAARPTVQTKLVKLPASWYVQLPTQQTWGPVTKRQLDEAVAAGRLSPELPVWENDPAMAVRLVDLYPQLKQSLALASGPYSGQQLTAAVRPKTFLENLLLGPSLPRYKADKSQETYEERQLVMYTYLGIWALVLVCGTGLAGIQGGAESAIGAFLGFIFASLIPVGLGLLHIAAGLFEPEWLMNCWDGRRRRWFWGDQGARYSYMVSGFLMFVGGSMLACIFMAVGGMSGYIASNEEEKLLELREPPIAHIELEKEKPAISTASNDVPSQIAADQTAATEAMTEEPAADGTFVEAQPLDSDDGPKDVAYQLKTLEESHKNAYAAYSKLREQWDAAYNKSAELVKTTGGLASDAKGELKAADEVAVSIARTLAVAVDSVKAAHTELKTFCDEHSIFSDVLSGYVEPLADVPGLKEVERRTQVAKLALASGEEFVYLDAVTKVEALERQRRDMIKSLGTAAGVSAELQQLESDLQEARKWAYQTRRTIEQRAKIVGRSPLLDIYPVDRESVALHGTDAEQRNAGLNPSKASRFKDATRAFTMAKNEVERARARAGRAEQSMAAYQARFGRQPNPNDPVGQAYTTALKAFATAEKKLDDARTALAEAGKEVEIESSHLGPVTH